MIAGADRAERCVRARARARRPAGRGPRVDGAAERATRLAPLLRGALAEPSGDPDRPWRRMVLEYRASDEALEILAGPNAEAIAAANPLTPDHVIRTKGRALLLPEPPADDAALRATIDAAVARYRADYDAYFAAHAGRARTRVTKLDPVPRVILVPGVGVFTAGRTKQDARIAADIAEHTLRAKALANAIGRYTALADDDLFDMEYWSLEQAKLGKAKEPPLAGQVALVTGAAGAIGFGICAKLVEAGAHVVATDVDGERLAAAVAELDPKRRGLAGGVVVDVTDEASVAAGFAQASCLFGGIDVLVLNAGVAHVSPVAEMDAADFRRVLDVNLHGYFLVLREATRLFRRQATGGHVIVNSSKNVFAPGADFGAYSASKAAAHQLGKVAALELAGIGVRVNMVNADAVFGDAKRPSGLWQEVGPAHGDRERLVLRRDPPGQHLQSSRRDEFALLRAAAAGGLSVPRVRWCEEDPAVLGSAFFVMDFVEGETLARRLLRDAEYAPARAALPAQLADALARIHRVDPGLPELAFLPAPAPGETPAAAELGRYEQIYRAIAPDPHPALELAFRWLAPRRPAPGALTVVHGDYRIGNLLFGPEGLRAVLDWELAHVGDPLEDLGWICVRSWRFGADLPVGGLCEREPFFAAYERASGRSIDRDAVRWWEVFGNLRWGIMCIMQARTFLDGAVASVELASLGRRVAEM